LGVRDYLLKLKIHEINNCRFRDTHSEILKHLFFECLYIREFWENINEWIYSKINVIIPLDVMSICLGYQYTDNNFNAFNYLFMVGKGWVTYANFLIRIDPNQAVR
jgi:hypothetical protein